MSRPSQIRVLIVDDEKTLRETITHMMKGDPEVKIVGSYSYGPRAAEIIEKKKPDVVLFEIQKQRLDQFSLLQQLGGEKKPYLIFVTAQDQYAVQALEVDTMDFLLKPLDREAFRKAIERAKYQIRHNRLEPPLVNTNKSAPKILDRILISKGGNVFFLRAQDIDWIQAQGKHVHLHCGKEVFLLKEAIHKLEDSLDPVKFIRIHKSSIVNIDRIHKLKALFHSEYTLILKNGTEIALSRSYRHKLFELLGKPVHGDYLNDKNDLQSHD